MATIHGNSARDAVRKLQTLPLLAGENISSDFIAPTVARSIDYVIHVGIDSKTGQRRLREISEVMGRIEGNVIEMHQIYKLDEDVSTGTEFVQGFSPDSSQELGPDYGPATGPESARARSARL
jgi:pilus assembly protein CpaF